MLGEPVRPRWLAVSVISVVAGAIVLGSALLRERLRAAPAPFGRVDEAALSSALEAGFLRPGDIVFRRGESVLSTAVMFLDQSSAYSHVGIVARASGELVVVHSVVDEEPDTGGSVRADTVARFLAPDHAAAAAVYRLRQSEPESTTTAEVASQIASDYAARHVQFDRDFDLDSEGAVYCTELVWRVYQKAGVELVTGELPTISFCLRRRRAVLPSTLQGSPKLQIIWQRERN